MQDESPLGQETELPDSYAPGILFAIPRAKGRADLGIGDDLPFSGVDLWNAYELSWLDERGVPVVAVGELSVPATSPNIVESKSLKLYLSSLCAMRFASPRALQETIEKDLREVVGTDVKLQLTLAAAFRPITIGTPPGECIDEQQIEIDVYDLDPELLQGSVEGGAVLEETLYTHLLKTNCPITRQPDWATLLVHYRGERIQRSSLLRYVVSFRNHDEFHEQCVERIFMDLQRHCQPQALSVYARYTRRGGLDINPFRSDFESPPENCRVFRQ